jgi:hypothetical protein
MRRLVWSWVSMALVSCLAACKATPEAQKNDPVSKGLAAVGGAEALAGTKTYLLKGTIKQWEPEQSVTPDGEPRMGNDSTFSLLADVAAGTHRIDWERKYTYPQPRVYTYGEIVTPTAGYVEGIDSTGRNKQSLDSNPAAHSMSGLRLAATQRELARSSPVFLGALSSAQQRLGPMPDVTVAGVAYPAVAYKLGDQSLTVMFDAQTGLPARVRAPDYDNIWGDVDYDLVFSDWRAVDKLQVPGTLEYELNGKISALRRS